jgi:hypothetical protein
MFEILQKEKGAGKVAVETTDKEGVEHEKIAEQ